MFKLGVTIADNTCVDKFAGKRLQIFGHIFISEYRLIVEPDNDMRVRNAGQNYSFLFFRRCLLGL